MRGTRWKGASRTMGIASIILVLLMLFAACSDSSTPQVNQPVTPEASPVPTLDPSLVAKGQQIYGQSCAVCHGPNAEGDPNWRQPNERGNLPPPPHDDSGHTWRHGDGELFEIVHDGWRDPFNATEELTMPPFGDALSDQEIRAVIEYIKSLWSDEHRRFQIEESQDQPFPTPDGGTS